MADEPKLTTATPVEPPAAPSNPPSVPEPKEPVSFKLPENNLKNPASNPWTPPITPTQPPATAPKPTPTVEPRIPVPSPRPVKPDPAPVSQTSSSGSLLNRPLSVRSSIRTMQGDVEGSRPSSLQSSLPKPATTPPLFRPRTESTTSAPLSGGLRDSIEPPSTSTSRVGNVDVPRAPSLSGLDIPEGKKSMGRVIIIAVAVVLLIVIAVVAFLIFRNSNNEQTPEPTISQTIDPTPSSQTLLLESRLQPIEMLQSKANEPFLELESSIRAQLLIENELRLYNIVDTGDANRVPYSVSRFNGQFGLTFPNEVLAGVDARKAYFTLYGTSISSMGRGFIFAVSNPGLVDVGMRNWEPQAPMQLKNLFAIDPTRASSDTFVEVVYGNIPVRFKNFPDPLQTIDYAIVALSNGEQYLLVTNTKNHILSLIDALIEDL
jgi:hypothetical protein